MELDHLVVAARNLDEGARYIEQLLGVTPEAGGQHARMGTHNRLLNLGGGTYLEIIAIDPAGAAPSRPRWFGLDTADIKARLASGPKLIHWVAGTRNLDEDAAASAIPVGEVHPMERGDFKWRITIPGDGHLPGGGVMPTLIQWDIDDHPTRRLPESGCKLQSLRATHPDPGKFAHLPVIQVIRGDLPGLQAVIATKQGMATLAS